MPSDKRDKKPTEERDKAASDDETDEADDEQSESKQLKPARPKIGEDTDNLKQREEWFQKRTGRK